MQHFNLAKKTAPTAEQAHQACAYLQRVAALIERREFNAWFFGFNGGRFDWADEPVYQKLRRLCLDKVRVSLPWGSDVLRTEGYEILERFAVDCRDMADAIALRYGVMLTKRETAFTLKRGVEFAAAARSLLVNPVAVTQLCREVRTYTELTGFVEDGLGALNYYAVAQSTMVESTGSQSFERILNMPIITSEWIVAGYPHDLLVIDAQSFQQVGHPIVQWLYDRKYCSTWIIREGEAYDTVYGLVPVDILPAPARVA